jgi:hypothetical protein
MHIHIHRFSVDIRRIYIRLSPHPTKIGLKKQRQIVVLWRTTNLQSVSVLFFLVVLISQKQKWEENDDDN